MTQQKLRETLTKELKKFCWKERDIDSEQIAEFTQQMETKHILNYGITPRYSDCELWFEATTYAHIPLGDDRQKGAGIVFDYDALSTKSGYDLEDAVEDLIRLENEAQEILANLNKGQ